MPQHYIPLLTTLWCCGNHNHWVEGKINGWNLKTCFSYPAMRVSYQQRVWLSDWEKSEAGSEAGRTGERIFMHFPLVLWKPLDNWKVLGLGRENWCWGKVGLGLKMDLPIGEDKPRHNLDILAVEEYIIWKYLESTYQNHPSHLDHISISLADLFLQETCSKSGIEGSKVVRKGRRSTRHVVATATCHVVATAACHVVATATRHVVASRHVVAHWPQPNGLVLVTPSVFLRLGFDVFFGKVHHH